jgi:HSP20 family protein
MPEKKENTEFGKGEERLPASLFQEMDRCFTNFMQRPFSLMAQPLFGMEEGTGREMRSPSMDIYEEGDELVVKAELPGIDKKDLNITLNDNVLTISGNKKHEQKVEKEHYHQVERSYGSFRRSPHLPAEVDDEKVSAAFADGILEVRLTKTEKAKQKKIEIS